MFVYGGELGYEYRINNRWGAIGNALFSTGSTNKSQTSSAGSISVLVDHQRVSEYGASLGAKYYIGNFFVSGAVGYSRYDQTLSGKYDYPGIDPADGTYQEGKTTKYGVYQNYGIGYQIPLKNGNNLAIFMKGYNTGDWNMATGNFILSGDEFSLYERFNSGAGVHYPRHSYYVLIIHVKPGSPNGAIASKGVFF